MTNIFLTGQIQIGKSTVLQKTLDMIKANTDCTFGGFRTYKIDKHRDVYIREYNEPEMPDLEHKIATWCHDKMDCHDEVLNSFSNTLLESAEKADIIVLDELGFLEKNSNSFKAAVFDCLNSGKPCVGILRKANIPWQKPIYDDPDTIIIEVTLANRNGIPYVIYEKIKQSINQK